MDIDILRLIEGARRYVVDWSGVRRGEYVLIIADTKTHPSILRVVSTVAYETEAHVTIAIIPYNPVQFQGPGKTLEEALKAADKCLSLSLALYHDLPTRMAMHEYGMTLFMLGNPEDPEFLASDAARYPLPLLREIGRKVLEKVRSGRTFRLTHPNGTDYSFEGRPEDWGPPDCSIPYPTPMKGTSCYIFPGGVCGCNPPQTGNGVIVSNMLTSLWGVTKEPFKMIFEDGWLVKLEGPKAEVKALRKLLETHKNNYHNNEVMFGIHPKARVIIPEEGRRVPEETLRHSGTIHVAIGGPMGRWVSPVHIDFVLIKPTLYVDGEPLIENGHLKILDDPEIREMAKQYGDPDLLLTEVG